MRRQVEQALQDEMAALRDPERKIEAWAGKQAGRDRTRARSLPAPAGRRVDDAGEITEAPG